MTEETVGAKDTCFALVDDVVFDEVAEEAGLEEGVEGRATEGVNEIAEEADVEEGDEGRATEGVG